MSKLWTRNLTWHDSQSFRIMSTQIPTYTFSHTQCKLLFSHSVQPFKTAKAEKDWLCGECQLVFSHSVQPLKTAKAEKDWPCGECKLLFSHSLRVQPFKQQKLGKTDPVASEIGSILAAASGLSNVTVHNTCHRSKQAMMMMMMMMMMTTTMMMMMTMMMMTMMTVDL